MNHPASARRVERQPGASLAHGFGAAAFVLLTTLAAQDGQAAVGYCDINPSNGPAVSKVEQGQFTIELTELVWDRVLLEDYNEEWGAWCYVNDEGRVRGRATTGADDESPVDVKVFNLWLGTFTRPPGAPHPTFTVNESHLKMRADSIILNGASPEKIFAEMRFEVRLQRDGGAWHVVFAHDSRMHGQPGREDTFHFAQITLGDAGRLSSDGSDSSHPAHNRTGEEIDSTENYAEFIFPKYTQTIDLDRYGIAVGDRYRVEYRLWAAAGEVVFAESWSEAWIGDPFDAESGFELTTTHEAVEAPQVQCEVLPDPDRFADNGDGTITDARTGLMWQRCPVGASIDNGGTPDDLADDSCVADVGGTIEQDWQGALQAASNETLGGHADWRAPNAKELDSLVEPGCSHPAQIDPLAFPDFPATVFWTATPEPDDNVSPRRSWQLHFGNAELYPASRVSTAFVLPVRDTGAGPVAPGASITAGNAAVMEGDSGTTTLKLPVALSAPLVAQVSVDYVVTGLGATAGVDFTATAGTLTIPAGDTLAHIDVVVFGDTDVEPNELVRVDLDNPDATVRLRKAQGIGTILDDEPMFDLPASLEVSEGDANAVVDITVRIDRQAVETIAIDWSTRDGTAIAGSDYVAAAGTVVIQPGDTDGTLPLTIVGDLAAEGTESFEIEFDNPDGAVLMNAPAAVTINIVDNDGPGSYAALNDTGVTACATGNQAIVACPQAGYPGQDAEAGRDVTDADPSDGALGFSFVKRDADGDALANQAGLYSQAPWACVEDQVTGLYWEVKNDDPNDLRFSDHTFTWYNSSGNNDGGDAGAANGGVCPDGVNCDTEKYVTAINAAGLCGFNDWRLPLAGELFTIAWLAADSVRGVDTSFFPNHFVAQDGRGYWSATPSAVNSSSAMRVRLDAGVSAPTTISTETKSNTHRIRLVRGGSQLSQLP